MFLVNLVRADLPDDKFGSNVQLVCSLPSSKDIAATSVKAVDPSHITPVPRDASLQHNGVQSALQQFAEYREKENRLFWAIKKLPAGRESKMTATITLKQPDMNGSLRRSVGPVCMNFEIPMHNISHLKVKYLRINNSQQGALDAFRWVRYMTNANSYIARISASI